MDAGIFYALLRFEEASLALRTKNSAAIQPNNRRTVSAWWIS